MLRTLLASLFVAVAAGCSDGTPARQTRAPAAAQEVAAAEQPSEQSIVVTYLRPAGDYDGWNLWAWPDGGEGAAYDFDDDTGQTTITFGGDVDRMGLIVRRGEWEAKDVSEDRFVTLDDDGATDLWLVSGDPTIYTDPDAIDTSRRIQAIFLDAGDRITLAITQPIEGDLALLLNGEPSDYRVAGYERRADTQTVGLVYDLTVEPAVAAEDVAKLSLLLPEMEPQRVYARDVLAEDRFTALDAELGSRWGESATTFRTWSPVADAVTVLLFDAHDGASPSREISMASVGRGVWEATVEGDLHDVAYQIRFDAYGELNDVPDVHCFAANADSTRSVVIDLDRTDPTTPDGRPIAGPRLESVVDEVIYEVHVRDYSIYDEGMDEERRGTYLGLVSEGNGGIGYLKNLGVTAVHLLPIHDYKNDRHDYNWGYWTALFNVPEGDYSTGGGGVDAVRDAKRMVAGLHENDIRVILDVVYNHTATGAAQEAYRAAAPYYYFRTTDDGQLRNDAGTGNSFADERPMVRKHIVDSLKFWRDEYGVDGFRFDLIGTHRPETVQAIAEALPGMTLYGEPWTGGGPLYFGKGAQRGVGVAVFNDNLRNAIRGDLDGTFPGFATGPGGDAGGVLTGVKGAIDDFAADPTETVNYVSAHDNLTLWDKIAITATDADGATRRDMHKLAEGIVLTSQGVAFLHAGAEMARTKQGEHNSYNRGDAINALRWDRVDEFRDVHDYMVGLIALRRAHPAFRLRTAEQVREHLNVLSESGPVAFALSGVPGDASFVVAYNGEPTAASLSLPEGDWQQVVDADAAGVAPLREVSGELTLPPYSMAVLRSAD